MIMSASRLAVVAAMLRLLSCLDCTSAISGDDHGPLRCEDLPSHLNGGSELHSHNIAGSQLVIGVLASKGERHAIDEWTVTFET